MYPCGALYGLGRGFIHSQKETLTEAFTAFWKRIGYLAVLRVRFICIIQAGQRLIDSKGELLSHRVAGIDA